MPRESTTAYMTGKCNLPPPITGGPSIKEACTWGPHACLLDGFAVGVGACKVTLYISIRGPPWTNLKLHSCLPPFQVNSCQRVYGMATSWGGDPDPRRWDELLRRSTDGGRFERLSKYVSFKTARTLGSPKLEWKWEPQDPRYRQTVIGNHWTSKWVMSNSWRPLGSPNQIVYSQHRIPPKGPLSNGEPSHA